MNNFEIVNGLSSELKHTLTNVYKFHPLDIEDVFTNTQLSKVETHNEYLYVGFHFPEFGKERSHFVSKEIHCFISRDKLLVIDKENYTHLNEFNEVRELIIEDKDNTFDIFYEMVDFIITKIFNALSEFKYEIEEMEKMVFEPNVASEDQLIKILVVNRNLINFISLITPIQSVILELETEKYNRFINEKGIEKLDDSLDKIEKMINRLHNYKEQIYTLKETNRIQIARNTNQTIKTLTGINLLILVPTIITSFFGMNVFFGWNQNTTSLFPFLFIVSIVILLTVSSFIFFKYKKWI